MLAYHKLLLPPASLRQVPVVASCHRSRFNGLGSGITVRVVVRERIRLKGRTAGSYTLLKRTVGKLRV